MNKYDVAIIGSGPGGYVCAIRCAQLGMKTVIIEKYPVLGGTCTNVGCIPSKALLDSSELYSQAAHRFENHGIAIKDLSADFPKMVSRKDGVVKQTVDGIRFLMKKNKIDVLQGTGSFESADTIRVTTEGSEPQQVQAKNVIIATGSKPSSLKGITIDKKRIITSTEALNLSEIPNHLVVIGGGVIGLELGSVYARLGSKVTVIEYMNSILPNMDAGLGKELNRVLRKQGFTFHMGHAVKSAVSDQSKVVVTATENSTAKELVLECDYCLVSVGRSPFTEGLGLDKPGVKLDDRGRIITDERLQTNIPGIYAIGDVITGPMLAHKAEEDGVYVAELLAGQKPHLNYLLIPGVVYTWPEVAAVGYTEEELKSKQVSYKSGSFPFKASGRARASMDTDGFIKVLSDSATDEILGVHMIGPRAADMIGEAVVAMEFRASAEDIARISHAHPTYSEIFREACLAATDNRSLHI